MEIEWVCLKLKLKQANAENIFVAIYNTDTNSAGWRDSILYLQELRDGNYQSLDITVYIQIIRIQLVKMMRYYIIIYRLHESSNTSIIYMGN